MKTASRIMYTIALIGNLILCIFSLIAMIVLIVAKVNPELAAQLEQTMDAQTFNSVLAYGLGATIYLFVASLIVLIISFSAMKRGAHAFVHILLLIGGILNANFFYVFGAIFGLLSRD